MLKTYFKTAWRQLRKHKAHSFINIAGLSIGMAVAVLIGLWMNDELSFNKSFEKSDRLAQVIQNVSNNGEVQTWWSVPFPLADELRKNYGEDFVNLARVANWGEHIISVGTGENKLKAIGGFFEQAMPEMFTADMINGTRSALQDPSSVLISASAAKAWFGEADPTGKTINIGDMEPVKVAGVYKDFPLNSTLANLQFMASWDFWFHANNGLKDIPDPWRPNFISLYAEIKPTVDFAAVSTRIKDSKLKNVNPQLQQKKPAVFLQPLNRIHLYGEYKNGINTGGAITYVRLFGMTGAFVLLLACINFMNLSTARSEKRAREVGIRKTVGSLRSQLIMQFFGESLLTVLFAFVISLVVVGISLPFFNEVADKQMQLPWKSIFFWGSMAGFIVFTALVAGSYPALYLSSFQPVKVLKGTFKAGRFAALPRRILVVLQFTVSVILIIGTVFVYRQVQFAKDRPVGYSRSNLLTVPISGPAHEHWQAVESALMQSGTVEAVAESESPTTGIWNTTSGVSWPGKDPGLSTDFGVISASFAYGKTVQWEIVGGRNFSKELATDSASVILNEAAVKYMGLKNPLDQSITWWDRPMRVIGVVKNMLTDSPYEEARPVIYTILEESGNLAIIRLNPSVSASAAIDKIAPVFKRFNPDQPFEYKFVDEEYARKFGNEERVGTLSGIFTILVVIISCLGLFGLASFVAEQRTKEIGVRKILGASVFNLWSMLSGEFVRLVIISFCIAAPLAWYFMQSWLQKFTYHTSLSLWVFAAAGLAALFITLITVSFQSIKAALGRPVKSLRSE
ncbi:ABC transporter permease [Terrimonas sp. NA20]|uniref:ABC transporter permease n=1 Tax=Terrimonas ginsenosidimutans TaxID=2908004 RepID=A0ABS9KMB3_9BACT|nr:ABC transporter permease [Terrimonas ginsenosidimutans]MCG2613457.1 ABC transporter permease [Terrimonas ginsenosidimutans]